MTLSGLCLHGLTACNANSPAGSSTVSTQLRSYSLFSWQSDEQSWSYALLPASREDFTSDEIIAAKLDNLDQLKSLLFQLNNNSIVFWNSDLPKDAPENTPEGLNFSLPEGSVIAEIRQLANRKRLVLEIF